jgi:hypothetical protein
VPGPASQQRLAWSSDVLKRAGPAKRMPFPRAIQKFCHPALNL